MDYTGEIKKTELKLKELKLFKEAIGRGFIKGAIFNSPCAKWSHNFNQEIIKPEFVFDNNMITVGKTSKNPSGIIYMNGEWAEIIEEEVPEYTMEELIDKLGYTFKIKK